VLWILIRMDLQHFGILDPHQTKNLDPDPNQSDKLDPEPDPDPHQFADESQNVCNMSLF
jgi:hypothetical protein